MTEYKYVTNAERNRLVLTADYHRKDEVSKRKESLRNNRGTYGEVRKGERKWIVRLEHF